MQIYGTPNNLSNPFIPISQSLSIQADVSSSTVKSLGTTYSLSTIAATANAAIPTSQKGAASGIAPLNISTKLATSYLITNTANGLLLLDSLGNASSASILPTGATSARTLAAMAADITNVAYYGWVGNGTVNDSAAYQAAYNATVNNGIINIPPGNLNGSYTQTAGKTVTWQALGHFDYGTSAAGTNPVTAMGDGDLLVFTTGGRVSYNKITTNSTDGYANVSISLTANNATNSYASGSVVSALSVYATSSIPSGNVGAYAGNFTVTTTIGCATTDNIAVAANVYKAGAANTWAFYGAVQDTAPLTGGNAALSGSQIGEFDYYCNGSDPAPGVRQLMNIHVATYNSGLNGQVYSGVWVNPGVQGGQIGRFFIASGQCYDSGFDASGLTAYNSAPIAGLRLGNNIPIDFTATIATPSTYNKHILQYNNSTNLFEYVVNNTVMFCITDTGTPSFPNLPTSAAGLTSGQLWRNGNVVNIV